MKAAMVVLEGLATVAVGIVAGCYLDGSLVLVPAQRRLSGPGYVEVEQANTAIGTIRYRLLLAAALLAQLALLVLDHRPHSVLFVLTSASLVLLIGATALITVRQVVPINQAVHRWEPQAPPENWQAVRARWHHLHHQRTGWVALAFLLQVGAVLVR